MASTPRSALTLARPRRVPLRSWAGRLVVCLCAAVALAGLAYGIARKTSLFAVRTLDVRGAGAALSTEIEAALAPFQGESLVGLDPAAVERAVEAVPAVRSAGVERDFPGTLHVAVTTEKPVAVVRHGEAAWLVSSSGKVLEAIEIGGYARLPRVWLSRHARALEPAERLRPDSGGVAVAALAVVPAGFPSRVVSASGSDGDLTLVLPDKIELRLGEALDVELKLAVAATVLASLTAEERERLGYLDLSLPARPVGGTKPQVEA